MIIEELKSFWSNYKPYDLHPEDKKYLGAKKQNYCIDISIEELRENYGSDLKSEETLINFIANKENRNKILINLFAVPFIGNVEDAKLYILMGNPGFHTGDYVDEIEDKTYIELLKENINISSSSFMYLRNEAINTGGYKYWSNRGKIFKIAHYLGNLNQRPFKENLEIVMKSTCVVESVAYHSIQKPSEKLYNMPSSKLNKRLVNEYIQEKTEENNAMCFIWRSVSFWGMKKNQNILLRDKMKARLPNIKNDEAELIAKFLMKN
jgi:hypothetical protein